MKGLNYYYISALCEKYNQQHLLRFYNKLDVAQRDELLQQIATINFDNINSYIQNSDKVDEIDSSKIKPFTNVIDKSHISQSDFSKLEKYGEEILKNGEYAVLTMAGGQGTRLGFNGPKGTYLLDLDTPKSLFELQCEQLKKSGYKIHWYIMTSEANNHDTVDFFERNNYFDYDKDYIHFFVQGMLPMVEFSGKIVMENKYKVKMGADGHGGVFNALIRSGNLENMQINHIKYVYIGGIDNVLSQLVDKAFIGLTASKNIPICCKSLIKDNPYEKVGNFCLKDDMPYVIEYSEMTDEMANLTDDEGNLQYADGHILCNMFSVNVIESVVDCKLPIHIARKKSNIFHSSGATEIPKEPNAYKFETFLFDIFSKFKGLTVYRVDRESNFAPIKNATGVDSPETAKELYINYHK